MEQIQRDAAKSIGFTEETWNASVLEFVCYDERRTITEESERDHVRKCTFSECV